MEDLKIMEDLKFTWLENGDMIDSIVERDFEEDIEVEIVKGAGGSITLHFEDEAETRAWIKKMEAPEINSLDDLTFKELEVGDIS